MHYRTVLLGTVAALGLSTAAIAAEPTPEGAQAIVKALTGYLPANVTETGFVTAIPEGDHYRLSVDFSKLVSLFKSESGKINFSALYDLQVFPPEGPEGLMKIRRESAPLSMNGAWDIGAEKGNFSYLIKDYVFDGQFDPAISYVRSATGHASGGSMNSDDGKARMTASFGPADFVMAGQKNAAGAVDLSSNGTVSGLSETITPKEGAAMTMSMGNIAVDAKVTGLKIRELSDLVGFLISHAEEKTPMPAATRKAAADLLAKAMPGLDAVTEEIRVDDLAVMSSGITAKFGSLGYRLGFTGLKDDSQVVFGLSVTDPQITGVPQVVAFGDLIPKSVTMSVSINGLNFATMANRFIEQADKDLSDAEMDAIGKAILKDGRMQIEVPEFEATSPLYNISVKGHVDTDVQNEPAKANAVFDVTARDLDKTIKGIQDLAQSVPDLNTASFGLMMAKGMAKNEADGSSHWKVEVAEDGQVKINGQVMPH